MGFWRKLFRRKKKTEETEAQWDQVVYSRDGVDFTDGEQRQRYVVNCLEQMAEASRELDLLTGEYNLVTSYLTDIEEIEALPEEEKEELLRVARKLNGLEQERAAYQGKQNRMPDGEYYMIRKQEDEVEEGLTKLKEGEAYHVLVKQDLQRLDGERHAYDYRRQELLGILANLRGMAVIFLTALVLCLLMLAVLQFGFEMNTYVGYFLSVGAGAIAITVLCVKYTDSDRELLRVERAINRLIQLQNKVKIRYVNNTNLLDYLYIKYNTDSAAKLERRWEKYLQEKEERKQFAEAEAKLEYYARQLVSRLSRYRVKTPERWVHQTRALLDEREMVEIRHDLILRRQSLRKQLDYNNELAQTARGEVRDIVLNYPQYGEEITQMVGEYEKRYR